MDTIPVTSEFKWPDGISMGLSLTFDDGRRSQWECGVPILNRYGAKGTFYILPKALETHSREWKSISEAGHEIGNHTLTHPCSGNFPFARHNALEEYNLDAIAAELDEASLRISAALGRSPKTFAYPCGQKFVGRGTRVLSYVPLVAERFTAGRGWRDERHNCPGRCDLAQLYAVPLDGLDAAAALAHIELAHREGGWLIFAGHDVAKTATHGQTVLADTLEAICEEICSREKSIWLETVACIAEYVIDFRTRHGRDLA